MRPADEVCGEPFIQFVTSCLAGSNPPSSAERRGGAGAPLQVPSRPPPPPDPPHPFHSFGAISPHPPLRAA